MKPKWKVVITLVAVVLAGAGVYASTVYSKRGVVTVQSGSVVRQDLTSIVTASGEIKPKNYINIGANAMGDLTELLVKEGDHVQKGQLLAKIEDVQPQADVRVRKLPWPPPKPIPAPPNTRSKRPTITCSPCRPAWSTTKPTWNA